MTSTSKFAARAFARRVLGQNILDALIQEARDGRCSQLPWPSLSDAFKGKTAEAVPVESHAAGEAIEHSDSAGESGVSRAKHVVCAAFSAQTANSGTRTCFELCKGK